MLRPGSSESSTGPAPRRLRGGAGIGLPAGGRGRAPGGLGGSLFDGGARYGRSGGDQRRAGRAGGGGPGRGSLQDTLAGPAFSGGVASILSRRTTWPDGGWPGSTGRCPGSTNGPGGRPGHMVWDADRVLYGHRLAERAPRCRGIDFGPPPRHAQDHTGAGASPIPLGDFRANALGGSYDWPCSLRRVSTSSRLAAGPWRSGRRGRPGPPGGAAAPGDLARRRWRRGEGAARREGAWPRPVMRRTPRLRVASSWLEAQAVVAVQTYPITRPRPAASRFTGAPAGPGVRGNWRRCWRGPASARRPAGRIGPATPPAWPFGRQRPGSPGFCGAAPADGAACPESARLSSGARGVPAPRPAAPADRPAGGRGPWPPQPRLESG